MARKEVHNAVVTRNIDRELGLKLRGAVFFDAPTLFDGEFPLPAVPCFPFASATGAGMFWVPKVGDEIEIEILADDDTDDTSDVELPEPRYRCMVYSDVADIDDEFKKNYPWRMGWKTNSGHILVFDDKEGEEFIKLAHKIGTKFEIDKEGNWNQEVVKNMVLNVAENLTMTITKNLTQTITENVTQTITKNLTQTIEKQRNVTVNDTDTETVQKAKTVDAKDEYTINVTKDFTLESQMNVMVKALVNMVLDATIVKIGKTPQTFHATLAEPMISGHDEHQHPPIPPLIGGPVLPPIVPLSSKAGTPLDPTALTIFLKGNV